MEAFNDVLLANWRLIRNDSSLLVNILKAKYFPHGDIFQATLGPRPSFTWHSILEVKYVISKGYRWLIDNGNSFNIWDRPSSFQIITPKNSLYAQNKVCDLIDPHKATWKAYLLEGIFLYVDAATILDIPLCASWTEDRLIGHYTSDGSFLVQSTYHMINISTQLLGLLSSFTRGLASCLETLCSSTYKTLWVVPLQRNYTY